MNILLFEDSQVAALGPVTTGRPAFAISCGSYRLVDLILDNFDSPSSFAVVRPHLSGIVAADFAKLKPLKPRATLVDNPDSQSPCLCINARIAPTKTNLDRLRSLVQAAGTDSQCVIDGDQILAAIVPTADLSELSDGEFSAEAFVARGYRINKAIDLDSINQLHDLIRIHCDSIQENLEHRIASGNWTEVADGVFSTEPGVTPGSQVATCTKNGPILLESNVSIGPFTFLEGPVYLGPHCKIAAHSAIKDGVTAGTTCKLGGEIEASIIEGYSNKQHYGFLGHSYLGTWINLGAGTCNSDLKNTYGKVNMQRDGNKIATNMQFVGCFIGDYAKTAINTSIFTGKTIGAGSMVYGVVARDVAAFTNDARIFGKVTAVALPVILETQRRMFSRRNLPQRDCDKELLRAMFELTADQRRGLDCEPLVL